MLINALLASSAGIFTLLFMYFNPNNREDITRVHFILIYTSTLLFAQLIAVAAGVEYMTTGTFSRLFFIIIHLCIVLIINWYVMLSYVIISTLTVVITIFLLGGDLVKLRMDHMHIPVLLFVFWFISRFFYLAALRDYEARKELNQAHEKLKRENQGRLKALEAIKKSEDYLRTLFEKTPDAYILFDMDRGKFIRINAYAEALFEYKNEEVIGKHYREIDILTEEHCRLIDKIIDMTIAQTVEGPHEISITLKSGRCIVVEAQSALTVRDGRTMIIATARDVTWRKHAEEELRKLNSDLEKRVIERSQRIEEANNRLKQEIVDHKKTENVLRRTEEQARVLIEKMNDGFVVFDQSMNVRYANERLCAMLGISPSTITGISFYDFVQLEHVQGLKDHLNSQGDRTRKACETILKNSSGGQLHVQISPKALYSDAGEMEGSFSVITDITRIKAMESALRESEEMTRALLNASRDSVVLLKPDGTILMVNIMMASNLKLNLAELKGKNIFQLLASNFPPFKQRKFGKLAMRKEPTIVEDMFDGRHFMIHIYPINDSGPTNERVAVFARDISDLKKAEMHIHSLSQELIKVQERERQRISRDLHDNIAQELASLKIICKTLFDNHGDIPADVKEKMTYFSNILQNTIMGVRDMAYDLMPPGLDQLGLVSTIGNYCDDYAERNSVDVDFFSAGVSQLPLTPDAEINLYRITQEALHNIVKHTRADRITVRLTASYPTVILRIEDNGKGFDLRERMADAFTEKHMGLRSMEERAHLLSGTITFRSQRNKGTKVVVEIPIIENINENNEQGEFLYGS